MNKSWSSPRSNGSFPDLQKEIALLKQGYRFVAGLDEVGRGAWAGPVVAAAVILPFDRPEAVAKTLAGLHDSKKLGPNRREIFFGLIQKTALAVSVGMAPAAMVDENNVVGATRYAMQQALVNLSLSPDYLLLDYLTLPDVMLPQHAFPKADNLSLTVAAASVIAKVTRDRLMVELSDIYPGYGFDQHKGYGTPAHRAALIKQGPCPLHRFSYKPLECLTLSNNN
ncbi:MAG: ribonuclease HII [Anaerolineae bacterium]|nr:ribonuclease HII [Anaerolineae bacterium]